MPICGFFFSQRVLSAQPVGGANAVELADTHPETKALSHQTLNLAACGRCVVLAILQHIGEHLTPKLRGMAMAPLNEGVHAFTLDALEQPIHGGTMHRDRAAPSCFSCGHPLSHRPDKLSPGSLPCVEYLTLVCSRHDWHDHSSLPQRHVEPHACRVRIFLFHFSHTCQISMRCPSGSRKKAWIFSLLEQGSQKLRAASAQQVVGGQTVRHLNALVRW
jgi:hypothetical protein